ncbi:MAG: hypothetical protein PHQ12_14530, partial [Chthoniobacteraceae bacterium]|nr:hypothetical protein [Chthoniobacteraceae bacterium]
ACGDWHVNIIDPTRSFVTDLYITQSALSDPPETMAYDGSHLASSRSGVEPGQGIKFSGDLPSPLQADTLYYVVATGSSATRTRFQISTTGAGGTPISMTGSGSVTATRHQGWFPNRTWIGYQAIQEPIKGSGPSQLSGAAPILGGGWYETPRNPYYQPTGTRASGAADIAGAMRTSEFLAGSFPHALAIGLDGARLQQAPPGYVWPANRRDFPGIVYKGAIPMGALVAILPSIDVRTLGLTPAGLAMARALRTYGAYVVDYAGKSNVLLYAETSAKTSAPSQLHDANGDFIKLAPYLALITNNTPSTPAGGGASAPK